MSIESTIEQFITDELMFGDVKVKLEPDTPLIANGILDSLALMRMILFIEEQFGIKVGDNELLPGNFQTINHIKAFVEAKRSVPQGNA